MKLWPRNCQKCAEKLLEINSKGFRHVRFKWCCVLRVTTRFNIHIDYFMCFLQLHFPKCKRKTLYSFKVFRSKWNLFIKIMSIQLIPLKSLSSIIFLLYIFLLSNTPQFSKIFYFCNIFFYISQISQKSQRPNESIWSALLQK